MLACAIGHVKKVAVLESHEIARVAYLGRITSIGSGRVCKLLKERCREGRDISVCDWASEKGCCLRIARNRTGSTLRPNNKYWKKLNAKIIEALLGGAGY